MNLLRKIREKFVYEMRKRAGLMEPFMGLRRFAVEPPVRHVVDGGAHHGHFSERLARVYPEAVIHCFEPEPTNFNRLKSRLGGNPRFRLNQLALASGAGTMKFFLTGFEGTHSLLPRPTEGRRYHPSAAGAKGETEVQTISLDEYFRREKVDRVGLMKLDLQGGERDALRGAADSLSAGVIDCIFMESFFVAHYEGQPLSHHLAGIMEKYRYSLFDMQNPCYACNGQLRFVDAIYLSPESRARNLDSLPEEA